MPMPALTRRGFLGTLAIAVPLPLMARRAHAAAVTHLEANPAALIALADVVLPTSELGRAGVNRAVNAFLDWGKRYRENAELNHGYGTSRLRASGPTPMTRWSKQLDDLDAAAQSAHQKPFRELTPRDRTDIVRAALQTSGQRIDRMPSVTDSQNVILALIAHFYDSSAATDLCYQAQIGRQTCRPLAAQSRKPLPMLKLRER
jgi:hypothetical protein